jgi:hypothetical protein
MIGRIYHVHREQKDYEGGKEGDHTNVVAERWRRGDKTQYKLQQKRRRGPFPI